MPDLSDDLRVTVSADRRAEDAAIDDRLVLEFVRGRNVHCPACAYNLRDAVEPVCPECGAKLQLTLYGVGAGRPRGYGPAIIGLTLGMLTSAAGAVASMPPPAIPLGLLVGSISALAAFVMVCLVETRFWRYWAKYAQHRRLLVLACWIPFFLGLGVIFLRVISV